MNIKFDEVKKDKDGHYKATISKVDFDSPWKTLMSVEGETIPPHRSAPPEWYGNEDDDEDDNDGMD